MQRIIKAEWLKLRRCQILLVGIVSLALCPIVQYGSYLITAEEFREASYDFPHLFTNVIWGNTQIFLPISLVMMGAWFIDREYASDTLKNVITVPVPIPKLLMAKLTVTGLLSVLFGIYSAGITLLTGTAAGLPGLSPVLALGGSAQIIGASVTTFLVCAPLILIFGQIRNAYLCGSIFTFFLGYSILFFKGGFLASAYPFSAALILAGFDMEQYNGAAVQSVPIAALSMAATVAAALILLAISGKTQEIHTPAPKKKRQNGRSRRNRSV